MKVAILGCGPSGLVAAHAAVSSGHNVVVYSRKRQSPIWGAQYLHKSIPDIPAPDPTVIRYRMQGTPEGYLRKVYGAAWDGSISDDLRDQEHLAWDIRLTYLWLWNRYADLIHDVEFTPMSWESSYAAMQMTNDLVINTLPRPALCQGRHEFKSTTIYALGDSDTQKVDFPVEDGDVIYNGEETPGWYRLANIHGFKTVEWPTVRKPPVEGVALVNKPLRHNCSCWPELVHAGRFGRWQRDKLVHDVFWDVYETLTIAGMKEKIK